MKLPCADRAIQVARSAHRILLSVCGMLVLPCTDHVLTARALRAR
jgi:hypothetical protein